MTTTSCAVYDWCTNIPCRGEHISETEYRVLTLDAYRPGQPVPQPADTTHIQLDPDVLSIGVYVEDGRATAGWDAGPACGVHLYGSQYGQVVDVSVALHAADARWLAEQFALAADRAEAARRR